MKITKFDKYISEAKGKKIDVVYGSFSHKERDIAIAQIDEILTIFKDEGLECEIDVSSFTYGGETSEIQIKMKVGAQYFHSDIHKFGKAWDDKCKEIFNSFATKISLINEESDNLFMKLDEIFTVCSVTLNDGYFMINVAPKLK